MSAEDRDEHDGWTPRGVLKYAQGARGLEDHDDVPTFVRVVKRLESEGLIELRTRTEAQYLADIFDEELITHFRHYPSTAADFRYRLTAGLQEFLMLHLRELALAREFKTWHLTEAGLVVWLWGGRPNPYSARGKDPT